MTLRDKCEQAAREAADCINSDRAMERVLPSVATVYIADAIERVARDWGYRLALAYATEQQKLRDDPLYQGQTMTNAVAAIDAAGKE